MKLEETLVSLEKKGGEGREMQSQTAVKWEHLDYYLCEIRLQSWLETEANGREVASWHQKTGQKKPQRIYTTIYMYILYMPHTYVCFCLPHILDVAGGHWCGNFINRLQQIVRNLWTRFAAKKLSEILAKKKLIALLCSEFVPEFFFSFVFSLLGKCKQMKSAATVNGASDKRNCRGRSPRGREVGGTGKSGQFERKLEQLKCTFDGDKNCQFVNESRQLVEMV